MIELAFVACSIVQGASCHNHTLMFADVSMITCMTQGQQPLAEWAAKHPNFTVGRWQCRVPGQFAKI